MNSSFSLALFAISKYSIFLSLLIVVLKWKKLVTVQHRIFALALLYLLTELMADRKISAPIWKLLWGEENNLPILHFFTVIQFGLVVWIYQDFLLVYFNKIKIIAFITGFAIFGLVNAVWFDGFFYLNPHARALQSLLLLGVVFSYFAHLLKYMEVAKLEKEPLFWISAGMTIYFSGSFLIFLFSNYLLQTKEVLISIYGIHSILNIVANVFIAIALWVTPPTRT